ncbi:MAG: hypothetical protein CM15mV87_440 [Caudoviricetes sp.]|nr:MAG: hypothetical protein CM15mV87_440 [Caudoviricetes sp.]
MAVHHGKEGEVVVGGTAVGELVSFTLETTGDVVESTKMSDSAKVLLQENIILWYFRNAL